MDLWNKESNSADALFIDLFAGHGSSRAIVEWDRRLRAADWKHRFLMTADDPKKDNKISDRFRAEGNQYFEIKASIEAMELYNKSLSFAVTGTENLSLAYANRATCFLRIKQYDKCLKDIELAVEANYPKHLMPKLLQRKGECLKLMQKHTVERPFEPKLSFGASEKFPCMADVMEIRQNDEFGRHMVATRDIDVGQTVLVEENFVSVTSGFDRVNCFECTSTMMNFMPCTECVDVMFCSIECQQRSAIHAKSCGTAIHRMPNNVKFIAKSILSAANAFESAKEMMDFAKEILTKRATQVPTAVNDPQSMYGMFLSLQPAKKETLDIAVVYQVFTAVLDIPFVKTMFQSKQIQRFLMHLIAEHFLIISNNSYGGQLTSASTIGTTALVMSFFNHACAPNLFNSSAANKEICISMRPIQKGEQLFVKYLCGDRTTRQRQGKNNTNSFNYSICSG